MANWRKIAASLKRRRDRPHLALLAWRGRRQPRDASRILVVRLDNIGDFVLWLDGARAIRHRYPQPDHRITLAAAAEVAAFATSSGLFDEVIAVDRRRLGSDSPYRRALWRQISGLRAAVAINPTVSRALMADELIRASGAPERVGCNGDFANQSRQKRARTDRWYTQLADIPPGLHEIEANAIFARQFDPGAAAAMPRLDAAMIASPSWLPPERKYVAVFPGAAARGRQWPAERFAAVIDRIQRQTGWQAVICGTAADSASAADIIRRTASHRIINACGRTTLNELAGVLKSAALLVSNETAAAHIAVAVECPAVVVMGGGHFNRFMPYPQFADAAHELAVPAFHAMPCFNCGWHCVFPRAPDAPFACLDRVSTDAVWEAVQAILARA